MDYTVNDLLYDFCVDLLKVTSINENYLPTDILLENKVEVIEELGDGEFDGFITLKLKGELFCTIESTYENKDYQFTDFGKTIMKIVLKQYLENIVKAI